jgi:hypothetical protein
MRNKPSEYAPKSMENYIMNLIETKHGNGLIKKGTFTDEIIWGKKSYIFSVLDKKKQQAFKKGMFLFGMVRKDAKAYLKENTIRLPKKYAQIVYNRTFNPDTHGIIIGADLNHAYWRIAYNLGIISANTYVKGLNDEFKSVRLAALSTMGADKKYTIIKDGKITKDLKIIVGDAELQQIYKLIRYTCYKYMNQVKKILGRDFVAYKTDAIYYISTKENRKLVRDFFKEKDLMLKDLE